MRIIFSTICCLMMNTLIIFNFTKDADIQKWYVVNDTVMGGKSQAKMGLDAEGHGMFQGHVSLDNNGGFSSIRYDANKTKLQDYRKFVIVLKGDGKAYQFRVKAKSIEYYSYIFNFETTGKW
jgi:NADH dehydrogenase [ubiquinone] 1 alpha subcomplex assembly factor 1